MQQIMQQIGTWLPVAAVALLTGVFNLLIAYEKFARDCRSPFFAPWKSIGLWWWVLLQLFLPMACLWLLYPASLQTPITLDIVLKAITVGLGFTAFVNANIDLGFAGVPLDKFYFALTQLAYQQIAARQSGKLAAFTTDLEVELLQPSATPISGLNYLRNYFQRDFALRRKPEEQQQLLSQVDQTQTITAQPEQAQAITSLVLEIRNRDCLAVLKRLGCREPFLKTYFPKSLP